MRHKPTRALRFLVAFSASSLSMTFEHSRTRPASIIACTISDSGWTQGLPHAEVSRPTAPHRRRDVIRESARKEFEAARFETDPAVVCDVAAARSLLSTVLQSILAACLLANVDK